MLAIFFVRAKKIALIVLYLMLMQAGVELSAQSMVETLQFTGKVDGFSGNMLKVDGRSFYIRSKSKIYSQAHHRLSLRKITINSLVDISYYKIGKLRIVDKIKLLDLVGSGNYKTFSGKIKKTGNTGVQVAGQFFHLDEFTIRIGLKLQKSDVNVWRNTYVTVTALKNDAGKWIVEVIREGITPGPSVAGMLAE